MYAVKGGSQADMEIRTIEKLFCLLGFLSTQFRSPSSRNHSSQDEMLEWGWVIDRPGTEGFTFSAYQYLTVEDVDIETNHFSLFPERDSGYAPLFQRVAVVSCPLNGPDGQKHSR